MASYSAGTTRRLMEIARRNLLRAEADLPRLAIARELRRLYQQDELKKFELFAEVHEAAVKDELLQQWREQIGNPNWVPNWLTGLALQNTVRKQLKLQLLNK